MISSRLSSTYVVGIIVLSMLSGIQVMHAEAKNGSFGGGDGTPANPYVIEDVWDLQNMSIDLAAHYVLGNDIDATATCGWNSGKGFEPVGTPANNFTGSLDGRNHTITGLFINRSETKYIGLFGEVGGTIQNVSLIDIHVNGETWVGGLAGCNRGGRVTNSCVIGNVSGGGGIGGLVGLLTIYGIVTDSYFAGDVEGGAESGGLVGVIEGRGTISNSSASGNVKGDRNVGGLVGYNFWSFVSNCYATGNVTGTNMYTGGLVAWNDGGTVSKSYAIGNVTGNVQEPVGGLVGLNSSNGKVSNCFWDVNTSGKKVSCGGTGKTTSEMMTEGTFTGAGWDFVEIWSMVDKVTYPVLRWQNGGYPCADAGPNQTVGEGTSVTFDGSQSSDEHGIVNYTWTFFDEAPRILYGVRPTYRFDRRGAFPITLFVTNTVGNRDTCTITVTVIDVTPPVADAGSDQTVDCGDLVTFDGTGSSDNVGIANYNWTFTVLTNITLQGDRPSYMFDTSGMFIVTLNVTDAAGNWDLDDMTVTVNDTTLPTARAGPDQTVDEGTLVTFDGSGSSDDNGVVKYTWSFIDRILVNLNGTKPTYQFDAPGTFVVTLNVSDAAGNWNTDTVTITVNDTTPPVADAGPDQTIDEGAMVTFDGSGSSDNVGIVNWTWEVGFGMAPPSGPEPFFLFGETPQFTFDAPTVRLVTLFVRDAAGNTHSDTMTLTVRDITPPIANAGPDLSVDEGVPVILDGSGSTDSGGIANYTWTFDDGSPQVLYGVRPTYIFGDVGAFEVTLTVKDAAGHSSTDIVSVAVVDRTPPLAEAGPDITAEVGDPVLFDGSGCSDNVGIINYTWECQHGEYVWTIRHSPNPYYNWPVQSFSVPFVYQVTLRVTDAAGLWSEDNMTLTLYDATPPVADAGPDLTVPVGEVVILNGTLSTDNGMFKEYSWTFIYNGSVRTLDWIVVGFTFDVAGVYEATLRVTDLGDSSDEDSMTITVVDTGNVNGTVLDIDGRPVGGAKVVITASDDTTYSTRTVANGSFALDVLHGDFTWRISKEGYKTISGDSSVAPMDTTELDLTDRPLVKEDDEWPASTSMLTYVALGAILVMVLTALVMVPRRKRGRKKAA